MHIVWYPLVLFALTSWLIYRVENTKKQLKNYEFPIKNNTIFYYLLLATACIIAASIGYLTISGIIICYLILFILHEIQWYAFHTQLIKDETESTEDFYAWCNHFNDDITRTSSLVEDGYDFSEGIFNGDFTLSNKQAMQNKYDLYYEYLKLKPGMKVLDIGCGNGHWGYYLKQKGIDVTGIVISKDNFDECSKKGLKVILGDARIIIKDLKERFDAISAIGPIEHFSSVSQPLKLRLDTLQDYFNQVIRLIDPNSSSKMYLNSIMTTNMTSSKYRKWEFYFHFYLIASAFGSGYYPSDEEIENIYSTNNSKIIIKRDYTEDYRYIFVRNKKYLGNFKWRFNTSTRIIFLLKSFLTDPYCLHRLLFGWADSWLWQFGGNSKKPMPDNIDTPIRAYIYVVACHPKAIKSVP